MKIFRLFTIAAAALMMVACSNEDLTQQTQTKAGKMQFSATIAASSSGATTRTEYTEVTTGEAAGTINVVWKAGDEIALIHNGVKDVATVKTVNADGSATITGDITVGTNGEAVTAYYPAAAIELNNDKNPVPAAAYTEKMLAQDGTLKYIQDNLDTRMGEGTLKVDGDKATLSDNVTLASQIAIWKLTLQDDAETPAALSATQVSVKLGGEEPWTVAGTTTLGTATSTVYLAIDKLENQYLTIEATVGSDTYKYENEDISLALGQYYQSTVKMSLVKIVDLSTVTKEITIKDGFTVTGTLGANVKISIAAGATVTLDGVSINADGKWKTGEYAGITCEGDAIIILKDGSENTVKGFYEDYPGITCPVGNTLTIKGETLGTGSLTASSKGYGAGIGGGFSISCGNIDIQGGVITAKGVYDSPGIGAGQGTSTGPSTCGTITISGGTVTAIGGANSAGIGSGYAISNPSTCDAITISGGTVEATGKDGGAGIGSGDGGTCGDITITTGVTQVTATKGASAPNSIGAGNSGTCGTVTIGCTLNNDGNPVGGTTGAISTSPYTYTPAE